MSALVIFGNSAGFADMSSAAYQISQGEVTAGGGNGSSASFQMAEGTIRGMGGGILSSAHYAVEGKAGIGSNLNIPAIQSIVPGDLSRFYTDQSASFEVQASTPDNAPLQYQAKQDSTIKAGPQASSTLTWALGNSDKGKHAMVLSATGPDGTTTQNQNTYFFRRPVK